MYRIQIRLKWWRKSAPIIAFINSCLNTCLNFKSTDNNVLPCVLIMVLETANNWRSVVLPCLVLHGMIWTLEPVSMRNWQSDTPSAKWLVLITFWQSMTDVSVGACVNTGIGSAYALTFIIFVIFFPATVGIWRLSPSGQVVTFPVLSNNKQIRSECSDFIFTSQSSDVQKLITELHHLVEEISRMSYIY